MKYGIMESFRMHNSRTEYGLRADGDRASVLSKAGKLGFQGIEFGIGLDYKDDPLWTGDGDVRQAMREATRTISQSDISKALDESADLQEKYKALLKSYQVQQKNLEGVQSKLEEILKK